MTDDCSYWQRFYASRISRRKALVAAGSLMAIGGLALAGCSDEESPPATPTPEPPPETTAIRLSLGVCDAPFMVCEPFLREEGFSEVQLSAGPAVAQTRKEDLTSRPACSSQTWRPQSKPGLR